MHSESVGTKTYLKLNESHKPKVLYGSELLADALITEYYYDAEISYSDCFKYINNIRLALTKEYKPFISIWLNFQVTLNYINSMELLNKHFCSEFNKSIQTLNDSIVSQYKSFLTADQSMRVISMTIKDDPYIVGTIQLIQSDSIKAGEFISIGKALEDHLDAIALETEWFFGGIEEMSEVEDINQQFNDTINSEFKNIRKDVFVSHASQDKPFVERLVMDLENAGYSTWFDKDQIKVGDDFVEAFEKGVANSRYVAVVISTNFIHKGQWAKEEYQRALTRQVREKSKVILPLMIDNSDMPAGIITRTYADFRVDYTTGLEQLLDALKHSRTTSP